MFGCVFMRYELYEKLKDSYLFIYQSDDFEAVFGRRQGDYIIIDNKTPSVNLGTLAGRPIPYCDELRRLVFECKLLKNCETINEITDKTYSLIGEKEEETQKECELFFAKLR